MSRPSLGVALALFVAFGVSQAEGLAIRVPQNLSDPKLEPVRVSGARPGDAVKITIIRRDSLELSFTGESEFVADRKGEVNTGTMSPRSAGYSGVDPTGLFWAVESRPARPNDPAPGEVWIAAQSIQSGSVSATTRVVASPSTLSVDHNTPFAGAVWACPRLHGPHPVLIILGGSEGGSGAADTFAPLFAAQGFATLGLPYYNPNHEPRLASLPSAFTEIPIDRLNMVRDWLAKQPEADTTRIGLWGISKGAEFVLEAASYEGWVKAVVAIAPTDVTWEGWGQPGPAKSSFSLNGHPLPFQPYGDYQEELGKRRGSGGHSDLDYLRIHTAGRNEFPDRLHAARIPIERFRGSLLLIAGGADRIWPSAEMAQNITQTRRTAGERTKLMIFPNAEHALCGPGTVPLAQVGDVRYATIHARRVAWESTFEFLSETLK